MKYLLLFLLINCIIGCKSEPPEFITITVKGIEKIEPYRLKRTPSDVDVYYLIITDQDAYRVDMQGMWAHPEFIPKFKIDSTYSVQVIIAHLPPNKFKNIIQIKDP